MSVIIVGMDAPRCCYGCKYRLEVCGLHSKYSITNRLIFRSEYFGKLDKCPIKSIDELVKEIEENAEDILDIIRKWEREEEE